MKLQKELLIPLMGLVVMVGLRAEGLAGGIEAPGVGFRGFVLGGAMTALVDDWSAIYWNPGALALVPGNELGFFYNQPFSTFHDGNSVKNFDLGNYSLDQGDIFQRIYADSEPARFREKEIKPTVMVGGGGLVKHWEKGWTIAGGFYFPFGTFSNWRDDVLDPISGAKMIAGYYRFFAIGIGNLSLSKRLTDDLSVGGGLNLIYSTNRLRAWKKYLGSIDPQKRDYLFVNTSQATGWGLEGTFGILYRLHPLVSLGGIYRSGAKTRLEGDMNYLQTAFGLDEHRGFDQDFYQPATYGLGIALHITPDWGLAFAWQQTDWTSMKLKLNFHGIPGRVLNNIDEKLDWNKSNRYRMGMVYKLSEAWTLLGGYYFDQHTLPGKALGLTNITDPDFHYFSAGVEYQHQPWKWGFGLTRSFGQRRVNGIRHIMHEDEGILLLCSYQF